MSVKIQIKRANASAWTAANPTLAAGEWGMELDTKKLKLGTGALWNSTDYYSETLTLNSVGDVTISSLQNGDFLRYSSSASAWINDPVNLSTDTVGDYVQNLTAGTGVTLSNNSGEGASPTVAIGQDVATSASVQFAKVTAPVTGNLTGNADTATTLQTPRTISLSGDVSGSVSFNGSANVNIAATVQPNSVALGTDTTGNYVSDLTQGTGVTVTHTPGEGSSPTVAIGQDVATSASVQFAKVTAPLDGNASTASTLQTPRTIALTGDVSGSVSFNGASDVSISATVQPNSVALGTDTTGNYVNDVTAGTGVTVTHTPGEGSSPTIAIGQAVATSSSVQFAAVTAPLTGNVTGNADTATALQTARVIALSGDVSGSVSFNGTGNVDISTTIGANSVSLGSDTSGDYVSSLVAGTGVSLANNSGETATPTISIGQDVATSASVTFAKVDTTGDVTVGGNLTVNGTTTTLNTETLSVEDNIVVLNSNATGSPALNAGIEVERGDSANVVLRWNESTDKWETTNDGSAYSVIATNGNIALGTDTTGNYMSGVSAGTGISVSHTPGEGSSASISLNATLDNLSDVNASASADGDFLKYVGPSSQLTWTTRTSGFGESFPNSFRDVEYGNGLWVAVGGQGEYASVMATSTDGTTWTTRTSNFGSTAIWSVAYGNNLWVAAGGYTSTQLRTSTDAVTWVTQTSNFGINEVARSVDYGNNLWVIGGANGAIRTSTDAVTWVTRTSNFPSDYTGNIFTVAYGNNLWVAAGSYGNIRTSTDAITWTTRTSNFLTDYTGFINSVAYGNSLWVAGGGYGEIRTSTDGTTWTTRTSNFGSGRIKSVDYGGGFWTAIADSGQVRTSTDGTTWTTQTSNFGGSQISTVAYGNNLWVIGGYSARILTAVSPQQVGAWVNDPINLGTDTTGDYVASLVAGTGVTLTNNSGETATPTIAIGQSVATSASVTFAHVAADVTGNVTGNVTGSSGSTTGNAATATALQNARNISLTGDVSGSVSFNGTSDVSISAAIQPNSVALGTDTTGNFVNDVTAGTGVSVTHTPGEGSSPTIAIGQAVSTSSSVTFGHVSAPVTGNVTGNLTGNADTAATLQTPRTISLSGDVSGSVSFNGSANVDISATVQPNSVALGTDTTGNYMSDLTQGTGVSITHTPGEGSNATIAIGQAVGTSSSVQFAAVTAPLIGNASTATTLENARTISLGGDVSGSASFNGSSDVSISATIQPNSVALGTDTTGNYVNDLTAGTGVTITHTPAEGSSPTVAIGQSVATSASVTFAKVDTTGDITVGGNLTVNGTTTTLNTETLAIEDNIVVLNSNVTGSPTTNAGIEVERGTSSNVSVRWNETSDKWELTEDGSTYVNIATETDISTIAINFLDDITDVSASTAAAGDFLKYNGSAWINDPINLGTDTVGNYVSDLTAGTGVTVTHTPGEGSSPTVAIGQAVDTSSSVQFAAVTAPLIGNVTGNADTATALATSRTIELTGDVTGSVSFNGSANASIAATIQPNSVALGTDTTGNYVNDLTGGTGVTITHTPGEGSSPTVAIGQSVATSASVTFAHVAADVTGNVTGNVTGSSGSTTGNAATATALQSERNISLTGDVSGSVSFNGTSDVSISATIQPNSVALGSDTTGDYVSSLVAGTGVTLTNNSGETATPTVAIGQAVGTSASVTFSNITATGVVTLAADPESALQAATKQYVDNISAGINFHAAVVAATTGNLAGTYNNGTSGVGATITKATNGSIGTIDGAAVVVGSRILVKSQTDSKQNGIYTVTAVGSVSAPWVVTRATDADNSLTGEMLYGDFCFVMGGSTNAGYGYINNSTANPIVIGTDDITYSAFNAAQTITNGSGINLVSNVLSVDTTTIQARVADVSDTEIGYLNGVTSAIQTQMDAKAPLASPTFTGTVTLPTGTVTSSMILDGTIANADISSSAAIAHSKLANATAGQVLIGTTTTGVVTATTISGDITIDGAGVATISANSVALGTDTTGNYVANVVSGTGITISHTPGEGSSASVALNATLDDLSNVTAPSPTDGQFLKYVSASSAWVPAAVPTINALDDIGNVNAPTPTDGQVLKYVSASSAWVAADATGGAAAPTTTTVSVNTATTIDSFALSAADSAEFTVKVKQGSRRESIKALALHNGTTVDLSQYGEVSIVATETVAGTGAVTWTARTSNFGYEAIRSVGYGNNLWVAAGGSGKLATSTDGTTWTTRTSNFGTTRINSVAYGNSLWVAAGYAGQIRTSTDGTTWTTRTSNFGTTRITSVAYGNSLWVAGGYSGQIRTSTDAITWTTQTSNFGTTRIFSVAYGNSLWVAAGYYGQIRTSTDGTTWTTRTSNFPSTYLGAIYSVAFGNNLWVAGGGNSELRTSTDAITWVTRTSNFGGYTINSVAYGNNLWVAGAFNGQLRTSTDGITWTTRTSNFGVTRILAVAYGNSLWVAAGDYSQLRTSAATTVSATVPLTLSADISGSDVRLRATITDAATTNAEVKVLKTIL